jgi:hypothetical protein
VFLNSPHREKVGLKETEKKSVFVMFLNSHRRETPENAIKKIEEKLTSKFCRFDWEKFLTWTLCKNILMVFLNSPCREAPKTALKKNQEKQKQDGGRVAGDAGGSGIQHMHGGVRHFFWAAPRSTHYCRGCIACLHFLMLVRVPFLSVLFFVPPHFVCSFIFFCSGRR